MKLNLDIGLNDEQVFRNRKVYGDNSVSMSENISFRKVFLMVLSHPLIIIMLAAIAVTFVAALKLNGDEQIGQRVFSMPIACTIATSFVFLMGLFGAFKNMKSLALIILLVFHLSFSVCSYILSGADITIFYPIIGGGFILLLVVILCDYLHRKENKCYFLLNKAKEHTIVKVIRNNCIYLIERCDLVVGDVIIIHKGEEIPADCEILSKMDFSIDSTLHYVENTNGSLLGENVSQISEEDNILYKGCLVKTGYCVAKVIKVGRSVKFSCLLGQNLFFDNQKSILKYKLSKFASVVQKCGYFLAILFCVCRFIPCFTSDHLLSTYFDCFSGISIVFIETLIVAIIIMIFTDSTLFTSLYTLTVAFNLNKMIKHGAIPCSFSACYDLASADVVCLDLTRFLSKELWKVSHTSFHNISQERLNEMIAVNTNAFLACDSNNKPANWGDPVEIAMLKWLDDNNSDYLKIRENIIFVDRRELDSHNCLATIIKTDEIPGKHLIYVKGDPEFIMSMTDMTLAEMKECEEKMHSCRLNGCKTVAFAYGIINDDVNLFVHDEICVHNLNFAGFMAFEPTPSPEIHKSISNLNNLGVDVKFVSNENQVFAKAFSEKSGVLQDCKLYDNSNKLEDDPNLKTETITTNQLFLFSSDYRNEIKKFYQKLKSNYYLIMSYDGIKQDKSTNQDNNTIFLTSSQIPFNQRNSLILNKCSIQTIYDSILLGRKLLKNIQFFILYFIIFGATLFGVLFFSSFFLNEIPLSWSILMWIFISVNIIAKPALLSLPILNKNSLPINKSNDRLVNRKMMIHSTIFVVIMTLLLVWVMKVMQHNNIHSLYSFITVNLPHQHGLNFNEHSILFLIICSLMFWHLLSLRTFSCGVSVFYNVRLLTRYFFFSFVILIGAFLIIQFGSAFFAVHHISLSDWIFILLFTSPILFANELIFIFLHKKGNILRFGNRQIKLLPQKLSSIKKCIVFCIIKLKQWIKLISKRILKYIKYIIRFFLKLLIMLMDFIHNRMKR